MADLEPVPKVTRESHLPKRHLLTEADRMVLKFAHLLEKKLDDRMRKLDRRIADTDHQSADFPALIQHKRVIVEIKTAIQEARAEFTNDAKNHAVAELQATLRLAADDYPRNPSGRKNTKPKKGEGSPVAR